MFDYMVISLLGINLRGAKCSVPDCYFMSYYLLAGLVGCCMLWGYFFVIELGCLWGIRIGLLWILLFIRMLNFLFELY